MQDDQIGFSERVWKLNHLRLGRHSPNFYDCGRSVCIKDLSNLDEIVRAVNPSQIAIWLDDTIIHFGNPAEFSSSSLKDIELAKGVRSGAPSAKSYVCVVQMDQAALVNCHPCSSLEAYSLKRVRAIINAKEKQNKRSNVEIMAAHTLLSCSTKEAWQKSGFNFVNALVHLANLAEQEELCSDGKLFKQYLAYMNDVNLAEFNEAWH